MRRAQGRLIHVESIAANTVDFAMLHVKSSTSIIPENYLQLMTSSFINEVKGETLES